MGKKWIYRLKKEDFANVAQRLNVTLDGRLEDMRKALSEYYSVVRNRNDLDVWTVCNFILDGFEAYLILI